MPSFILRNLDTAFWTRVQGKAKAEGTTVKSVILRLLAAWLGVVALLVSAGCSDMQVSPVAPSATSPVVVGPPTGPLPSGPPFTIQISANGGDQLFTDSPPFQTSVTVSGPSDPSIITVNCNNGAELQAYPGRRGSFVIACAFSAPGSYPIVATAVDRASGFSTSARTDVTVSVRPVPPPPPPPPPTTQPPAAVHASVTCTAAPHGQPTSCNVTANFDGKPITGNLDKVVWEYGNGDQKTLNGPLSQYAYSQAGTYQVIAHVYYQDHVGTTSTTVVIP